MLILHNNSKSVLVLYLAHETIKDRKKNNTEATHDGQIARCSMHFLADSKSNPPANLKLSAFLD